MILNYSAALDLSVRRNECGQQFVYRENEGLCRLRRGHSGEHANAVTLPHTANPETETTEERA